MITIESVIHFPAGNVLVLFSTPNEGVDRVRLECRFSSKPYQTVREVAKNGARVSWLVASLFKTDIDAMENGGYGWYTGDTLGRDA